MLLLDSQYSLFPHYRLLLLRSKRFIEYHADFSTKTHNGKQITLTMRQMIRICIPVWKVVSLYAHYSWFSKRSVMSYSYVYFIRKETKLKKVKWFSKIMSYNWVAEADSLPGLLTLNHISFQVYKHTNICNSKVHLLLFFILMVHLQTGAYYVTHLPWHVSKRSLARAGNQPGVMEKGSTSSVHSIF